MTDELPTAKARDGSGRRDETPAPKDGKRPMAPPARERPPIPPQPGAGPLHTPTTKGLGWWSWVATLVVLLIWNLVLFMLSLRPRSRPSRTGVHLADQGGQRCQRGARRPGREGHVAQPVVWPPASGAPGASIAPSASPSGSGSTPPASYHVHDRGPARRRPDLASAALVTRRRGLCGRPDRSGHSSAPSSGWHSTSCRSCCWSGSWSTRAVSAAEPAGALRGRPVEGAALQRGTAGRHLR